MSSSRICRIAAIVTLLYGLGHMSGYPWTPGETSEAAAVVDQMQSVRFDVLETQRSYWEFYFGFGLITGAFLIGQAALLWILGSYAREHARLLVPFAATYMVGFGLNAYLSYAYFFLMPAAFAALIALLMVALIWRATADQKLSSPLRTAVA